MLKRNSLIYCFECYLGILFVYANSSWLLYEYGKAILILQIISIILYLFLLDTTGEKLKKPNLIMFFFILMPFVSKILNINVNSSFVNTLSVAILYITLSFLSKEKLHVLLDRYARTIFFLCIITLIIGPITLVNYSILNIFPVHHGMFDMDTYGYYNLYLYTDRVSNDFRVQSIYWEPGAWAFNLTFAFYWLVIVRKEYKKIPYFIGGIILASSTTGFLSLAIIVLYLLFTTTDINFKKKLLQILFTSLLLILGVFIYLQNATNFDVSGFLYTQTVGKLTNSTEETSLSYTQRAESTQKAFNIAFANPFFGVGKLEDKDNLFVTSSIAEFAYQLGIIYTLVFILIFRLLFKQLGFVLSIVFTIVMLSGEAYGYFILCSLILVYSSKQIIFTNHLLPNIKRYNITG